MATPAHHQVEAHRGGPRSLHFCERVEVWEYSRLMGGSGGVPTDGSWAALGLGVKLRSTWESLAKESVTTSRGATAGDEADVAAGRPALERQVVGYLPSGDRIRLLRESM